MSEREGEGAEFGAALVDWMLAVAPKRTLSDRFAEQTARARLLGIQGELKLGRYLLRDKLSVSGAAEVHRARDPLRDRDVAVKLVHRGLDGPPIPISTLRIAREARALARLCHPNVVPVHEIGTWDNGLFIVAELAEGPTLADLGPDGSVPLRRVVELFLDAARGLSAAHEAGVAHRDFTAAKVVVGPHGRGRVFDFDIAQQYAAVPAASAAPLDRFACCTAVFEAVYGHAPDPGPEVAASSPRGEVPPSLVAALRRGLATEVSQRFADTDAMIAALQEAIDDFA